MTTSAGGKGAKDLYKVLNVKQTASRKEIKEAYRKLALALHPDRHDGCEVKADEFKNLNEAFQTLSDHDRRTEYDLGADGINGVALRHNRNRRSAPPPNYRKVYSPRAPPGFRTFDSERHRSMHYGDGMMREEIDRARKRYEAASKQFGSGGTAWEYQSPLGKGFSFDDWHTDPDARRGNPFSKREQGPEANSPKRPYLDFEYEESHVYDLGDATTGGGARTFSSGSTSGRGRVVNRREVVRERMSERRKNRVRQRGDPKISTSGEDNSACTIM